jgi:hypothetical protein
MKKRSRGAAGTVTAICLILGTGFFILSALGFGYFGLSSEAHTRIHSPVSSAIQKGGHGGTRKRNI